MELWGLPRGRQVLMPTPFPSKRKPLATDYRGFWQQDLPVAWSYAAHFQESRRQCFEAHDCIVTASSSSSVASFSMVALERRLPFQKKWQYSEVKLLGGMEPGWSQWSNFFLYFPVLPVLVSCWYIGWWRHSLGSTVLCMLVQDMIEPRINFEARRGNVFHRQ